MEIKVGVIHSELIHPNINAVNTVKLVCRARPQGYRFTKKYKKGLWNGYISLMKNSTTFPTGLLGNVVKALKDSGERVTVDWNGYNPGFDGDVDPNCLKGITLRDYQIEAATALLKAGRGIAKMATNAGKTEVMASIFALTGLRGIILVGRKELMYQTADRLSGYLGEEVGLYGDGKRTIRNVTVCMIQTLSKRLQKQSESDFKDIDVIFIDECHHGSSAQYLEVMEKLPGFMRFGFSGTPLKHIELDDLKLIAYTGRVMYELSNAELIDMGYSAKPVIHTYTLESEWVDEWELQYQKAYKQFITDNKQRNRLISNIAEKHDGDTVLILVKHISHGKTLQEMLPGSKFIHGSDTTDKRQQVLSFMKEQAGVYIASTIIDEGVDIPAINVLILAGGGKSERGLLQRIGRGLRQKEDNTLTVYDFIDDTNKYLYNHSEERLDVYNQEEFEVIPHNDLLR